jgi:hypothetical protein
MLSIVFGHICQKANASYFIISIIIYTIIIFLYYYYFIISSIVIIPIVDVAFFMEMCFLGSVTRPQIKFSYLTICFENTKIITLIANSCCLKL